MTHSKFSDRKKNKAPNMEPCSITEKLLQFNLGASGFQFLLGFFSVSLGKAFLNSLRSAVDEVFGFLQAESGQFTDSLNNLNLVSADFFQNDVEFGFFFSRSSSTARTNTAPIMARRMSTGR